MLQRVLAVIDAGSDNTGTVNWVVERAHMKPIHLELSSTEVLQHHPAIVGGAPIMHNASDVSQNELELTRAVRHIRKQIPATQIVATLRRGPPLEEIIFASHRADLIVVGASTEFSSTALPSGLTSRAHCPVVVIPARWQPTTVRGAPRPGTVIVAAYDDAQSRRAIEFAAAEADLRGSALQMVQCWRLPPSGQFPAVSPNPSHTQFERDFHAKSLGTLVDEVQTRYPLLQVSSSLQQGAAAGVLMRHSLGARLLVISAYRGGLIPETLMGSVTRALIEMPCPLAVIPPP
ncbi:MAG TPA: universal stress protein [Glaciihabitans sp.]|jgi:nucleotide-binding universal stress UspA family protein|nr:universal stress protein [Glaciihabitans sp.]